MAGKEETLRRVETGIEGLDELIDGGIPEENLVLLAGACGTGKTTLATQFLHHGAREKNEPGIYVTMEEEVDDLVEGAKRRGLDFQKLIDENKISIVKPEMYRFEVLKRAIEDETERIGAKRLVIDPFTVVSTYFEKAYDLRKALSEIRRETRRFGCTSLVISDIREENASFSESGYEEFVADGVIVLRLISKKESPSSFVRALHIRKMRFTGHSLRMTPMEISEMGMKLYPDAEVF